MDTFCLLAIYLYIDIYALCPSTPKVLLTIPTTLVHGGLLERLLGGLHCCSTYLKKKGTAGSCKSRAVPWGRTPGSWEGVKHNPNPQWWIIVPQGIKPGGRALDRLWGWTWFRVQPRPPGDTGRDRAGNWAGAQIDPARRQTQGKDWVPRAKQLPDESQGPQKLLQIGAQDPWQDGKS